jgi:hypothetical protein
MARQFDAIGEAHREFILRQRIFFTASAAPGSRVNISPRETGCFRLLGPNRAVWLDRTGSGNETAAHIRAGGPLTVMFCAFEGPPMILRLYGRGEVLHRDGPEFAGLLAAEFGGEAPLGARQMVALEVELVQTSCGFGVPLFEHRGERDTLDRWAAAKGPEGIEAYWHEKNVLSMDGLPTGLFD